MVKARLPLALWALAAAACATPPGDDLAGIADQAPLPYSVMLTGGVFVEDSPSVEAGDGAILETFGSDARREPVPLEEIVGALRSGRVFTRTVLDAARTDAVRARIATHRAELPLHDAEVRALLDEAREAGHDFVVVVQRLVDGPIEGYGINDRWPLTVSLWFLVGLGMFIPDHTFESRATLQAGVYEVHTGRLVHRAVGSAGPVELALVGRGNLWGLTQSILVPPFWVQDHDPTVVDQVRTVTLQRLVTGLARQLKSAACRQDLVERARATIELSGEPRDDPRARTVRVRSAEALGAAALRIDGRAPDDAAVERFSAALLRSEREVEGGLLEYEAALADLPEGRFLQVLVRTVAGDVASVTFDLEER